MWIFVKHCETSKGWHCCQQGLLLPLVPAVADHFPTPMTENFDEVFSSESVNLDKNFSKSLSSKIVHHLRRSVSDPTELYSLGRRESAVETLDRCSSLLTLLGSKVDNLTTKARNMPGICKKCHGQTGAAHVGSKWGLSACTLLHSEDCLGGITEQLGVRSACPVDFVAKSGESGNETEVSQQHMSDLEDTSSEDEDDSFKDPNYVPPTEKQFKVSKGTDAMTNDSNHGAGGFTALSGMPASNKQLLSSQIPVLGGDLWHSHSLFLQQF